MGNEIDFDRLLEQPVWGANGEKLGTLDDLYFDDANGQPTWGTMRSGLLANHVSFFPMADASQAEDGLHIGFSHEELKAAPSADPEQELSAEEEAALRAYYASLRPTEATSAPQDVTSLAGAEQVDEGMPRRATVNEATPGPFIANGIDNPNLASIASSEHGAESQTSPGMKPEAGPSEELTSEPVEVHHQSPVTTTRPDPSNPETEVINDNPHAL